MSKWVGLPRAEIVLTIAITAMLMKLPHPPRPVGDLERDTSPGHRRTDGA